MAINTLYPPGPQVNFLRSILFGENRPNRLENLMHMARTYGDSVYYRMGPRDVYMFNHPHPIHQVLVAEADHFVKSELTRQFLGKFLGNGLLLSDGEFWKRQRRLVQPAFHTTRISSYGDVMVEHADRMMSEWQPGRTLDISVEMMKLTLGIVAKTLFDSDIRRDASRVGQTMATIQRQTERVGAMMLPIPDWAPTPFNRATQRANQVLDDIINTIIAERRKGGEDRGDLLSMLLMARDEDGSVMTDRQVRDEAVTLFLAGHETTALAMTWTFYLLSQNPEAERRLHEELDRVLAGRTPTLADLDELKYTEKVVKESMRLYPPAYIVTRMATHPVMIGGFPLKPGAAVIISPYVVHRDERWFKQPDVFRPDRFTPEAEARLPRYAYFPFGGGPRVCIGNSFAMMEARLLLATIAQRYSLALDPAQRVEPEPMITLRPRHGMKMKLSLRGSEAAGAIPTAA